MKRVPLLSVLIPALLVVMAAVPIFYTWVSYQAKIEQYQQSEELYLRLNRIANSNIENTAELEIKNLLTSVALGNDTPAIVGAALQTQLRELAALHGLDVVQLAEMELVETATPDAKLPQKIGVRLDVSGPAKGLFAFLSSVEAQKPWLFVDNVSMQSGYQESAESQAELPLQLNVDIWGLRGTSKAAP